MSAAPALSVVVPVYGCRDCLAPLCEAILAARPAETIEIVLVDDRSPDQDWAEIVRLATATPEVRGIRLSRNFGQQIAISAGLAAARGARVAVMDCDLQDPPALLIRMMAAMDQGCDIVQARRRSASRSVLARARSRTYIRFVALLSGETIDPGLGSYTLLSRKVVEAYLRFGERERHYQYILRWLGFSSRTVEYDVAARHAGRSSYSLGRLINHALDGIFFQSTRLLRFIVALGLASAGAGFALALWLAWRALFYTALPGWTSLAVLLLVTSGAILASLGVVGAYVGKIFAQSKGRPLFVIDEETVP